MTNSTPRVLHVLTTGSGGGIERIVHTLSDHLVSLGWDCSVAYWRGSPPADARACYVRLRRARYVPTWPIDLIRLVRDFEPDLVHLHGPMAGSLGTAAVRLTHSAITIYTEHSLHERRPLPIRALRRMTAHLPHVNTAVSRASATSLAEGCHITAEAIEVITNGIPIRPVPPLASTEDAIRLIYVANFWPWKVHEDLIQAAIQSDLKSYEISFFGDGPRKTKVAEVADQLGVGESVTFHGYADDPWSKIRRPAIYIHVGRSEASGLAPMEAMMSGLPVIGYESGGLLDLSGAGEAVQLVPPGNIVALAEAIQTLYSKGPREIERVGLVARSFALQRLTSGQMLEGYQALYERLYSSLA